MEMNHSSRKSQEKLTNIKLHLKAASERCNSVQTRLDYYKRLYESVGPKKVKEEKRKTNEVIEIYHNDVANSCRSGINYQQPTIASKLKQAQRCYFTSKNGKNIPFVVGTSVTRSHNVGLNIQQYFSLLKHRQPSEGTPVLPMMSNYVHPNVKSVFQRLIDEFEGMNTRYNELREKVEKSTNKESFKTELSMLESKLDAKEDEINTVCEVYREVMFFKQQRSPTTHLVGFLRQIQSLQHQLTAS